MFVVMMLLVFGLSNLLRVAHNKMHEKRKAAMVWGYQHSPKYDLPTIDEAIEALAREQKELDRGGDVIVPRRVILMFEDKYHSGRSLEDLCLVYLNEYIK